MKTLKTTFVLLAFMLYSLLSVADTIPIDQTTYVLQAVSSDNTSHPANHAWDDDFATWWALWNSNGFELPGWVEIDLGESKDIAGFSYLPNPANNVDKASDYEFYVSENGTDWGTPEVYGNFGWTGPDDQERRTIHIGPIAARYVKVVYTTSLNTNNGNVHTGDLEIFESTVPATGQQNQVIEFNPIENTYSTAEPFDLVATATSGLAVSFEILSGPATIDGNTLTLDGTGGIVTVRAYNNGDATYYGASAIQSFEVFHLPSYFPAITNYTSEIYPIEMPELNPFNLAASAEIELPDTLHITGITFTIGAEVFDAEEIDGAYRYWWTPEDYGIYSIDITATASNGNSTTESITVEVVDFANNQTIQTFDQELIQFGNTGQWFRASYELPQFVGAYDQIIATLTTECPNVSGGCDDWDRAAWIDIKGPNGKWVELIRYITPYGVGCTHTLDVTDYASLLQGKVELRMYIETWGTGGWDVSLDFDYQAGTPDYLYSRVDVLWDGNFQFGDPANLQPFDTVQVKYNEHALDSKLKLVTTGHGWGANNTGNAAEFYHAIHHIGVDGVETFEQDLWVVCNPNPDDCSPQYGTWTYNRAGWCPGSIARVYEYNMQPYIDSDSVEISYIMQESYMDHCHPNNPDCVSGVTCEDCNASYNPHYIVAANLITYSNEIIDTSSISTPFINNDIKDFDFNVYPNPSNGVIQIYSEKDFDGALMTVNKISGELIGKYIFLNNKQLSDRYFDFSDMEAGIYFITIETKEYKGIQQFIIR